MKAAASGTGIVLLWAALAGCRGVMPGAELRAERATGVGQLGAGGAPAVEAPRAAGADPARSELAAPAAPAPQPVPAETRPARSERLLAAGAEPESAAQPPLDTEPAAFEITLPGTQLALEFLPFPSAEGAPLWLSSVEIPWEAYDVFLFGFDLPPEQRVSGWDAAARPSRPYGAPDRGLGHRGFAAQAMTAHAAEAFAAWLSERSGVRLRLPSASEWEWAARGALPRPADVEDDLAPPRRIPAELGQQVGFAPYQGPRPAALAALPAGPFGLCGLTGNLLEWVRSDAGGHTTVGGCFLDAPEAQRPERREAQAPSWNETDPQNPKSRWWLANAPFVGFRLLAEAAPPQAP